MAAVRRRAGLGPWLGGLVALGLLAAAAPPARADIYRCKGPDGRTIFTGDPSRCPDAEAHRPDGELQRTAPTRESGGAPAVSPSERSRARRQAAQRQEAEAARWRTKRRESEARLAEVKRRLGPSREALTWCNQGRTIYATDPDTGLRRELSCERIRKEHAELEKERERLRAYLYEGGLQEECRRAGCLPGWIR